MLFKFEKCYTFEKISNAILFPFRKIYLTFSKFIGICKDSIAVMIGKFISLGTPI